MKRRFPIAVIGLLACLHPHTLSAGLDITASPTPRAPPKDHPSVLVHHATDDKGGNTSLRFMANRRVDENKYTPDLANRFRGHGIRREGLPAFPEDWNARPAQPPGTLGFPDVGTFRDLHFAVTVQGVEASVPAYEEREVEGWRVFVQRALLDAEPALTARALELLKTQLAEVNQVVPAPAAKSLREVPLYFSPEYPGFKPTAEFHPDAGWLRANDRDPAMAQAIEFSNVRRFAAEVDRMPNFTLHELAHAYHHRVLPDGFANLEIHAAYERAKAGGGYERVERWFGTGKTNTFERAYAMTDPMEYFAETSEACFSRNDYFPFTRDELKAHDPAMFTLLAKLWGAPAMTGSTPSPPRQTAPADPPAPVDLKAVIPGRPVLTSADQVHRLSRTEASRAWPVRIRGVVTCSWPGLAAVVVQDSTRGIYVDELPDSAGQYPQVGDRIEVEGVTTPAEFAPQVHAQRVTRLGPGELPQPLRPSRDELSNGSLHTQYVEIQGVVTAASIGGLSLLMPGGSLRILLFDLNEAAQRVAAEDARIRLRGVVGASFDPVTQRFKGGEVCLFAPEIRVEESPPEDLFALPSKRVSELLLFDPLASALRRVKISGQVVHQRDEETYLMDGTNGLRFTQRESSRLALGALVEVVGFPMWTGPTPRLQQAVVRQTGQATLPTALRVTGEDLFQIEHDAVRVRVEAMLLNETADGRTLELQAHLRRFIARLDRSQSPLPLIPPGSRLELVGVHAGRGMALTPRAQFDSCELLLGSPADVRVVARPAWWTWWRWLMLVLVLAAVLAAALVWIRFLRRQVLERNSRLREEIRVREQAENQRSLAQERARIARDLHDDLGSTLTEITMLATPPAKSPAGPGEGPDRLGMIAQRSRMLVHALDATVWAVDPRRDTLESLALYLASYAEECLRGARVACRVLIPHTLPERSVPGQLRHHVFLTVKEVLNNAVRHSGASEVVFHLRVDGDLLGLSIVDNGRGFNPAAPCEGNGLPNLRDRMRDLGGRCGLESVPDRGTTVSLEIPLPVSNRVS